MGPLLNRELAVRLSSRPWLSVVRAESAMTPLTMSILGKLARLIDELELSSEELLGVGKSHSRWHLI